MAWTTPRTWSSEVLTSTNLNTHLRDNLNALYGTTTSYTPQIDQGVTTNIAKTVNEARYLVLGRVCEVWFTLSLAAAGTAGSAVTVSLPQTISGHATSPGAVLGSGFVYDASVQFYTGPWRYNTSTTVTFTPQAGSFFGVSPNVALASTDVLSGWLRYVIA